MLGPPTVSARFFNTPGQAIRPFFGQAFDTCGPKPSHSGPLHLVTCLNGHSDLFNACIVSSPNEVNAAKALKFFRRYGVTPKIALFDRAKSYLAFDSFRRYMKGLAFILVIPRATTPTLSWDSSVSTSSSMFGTVSSTIQILA